MSALQFTITGLTKVSGNIYEVSFTSNFPFTVIEAQYSNDGATWLGPIELAGTTSPQQLVIPIQGDFYLRLVDGTNLTQTRKHNNKFNLKHS